MLKKNLINGLITSLTWILFISVILTIRYGLSWWTDPDNDILKFFPIWGLMMAYVGYGTSKYYYSQKQIYSDSSDENAPLKWQNHKRWMIARLLLIIGRMFGMATPLYILAYFDKSMYISSSLPLIIIFVLICIGSFLASKWMFIKWEQTTKSFQ